MDDQRKNHIDPKRPPQRNCSEQLCTNNLPIDDVENTNKTNQGRELRLAYKPRIVPQEAERMPQRIQSNRKATLH